MSGNHNSGRRPRPTARFRGETWVRLSKAWSVLSDNGILFAHVIERNPDESHWTVNGLRFTKFDDAAAEFVRRVNGAQ